MTIDQSIYDILIFHQLPYTKHYIQQSIQLFYPNNQIIIRNKKHKPINLIIINSSSFFIRNRLHTFHHYNCKINNIIITKMTTLNYIQFQPRSKPKKKKKKKINRDTLDIFHPCQPDIRYPIIFHGVAASTSPRSDRLRRVSRYCRPEGVFFSPCRMNIQSDTIDLAPFQSTSNRD